MDTPFVPGMRLEIRDEQWVVRKVDTHSYGGQTLQVRGVSRYVKDMEAIFLSDLDRIQVIDPAMTEIVLDDSPLFRRSKLFIESQLRRRTPPDSRIYTGYRGAMNLLNYQLEPAAQAMGQPRQRILLADGVGLGKTLEAGIIISELIARGMGQRILVVAVKSMMLQFQKEFWSRFTIPLKRLDSREIQKIRSQIPTNHNPFYAYDKTIISIDTLKRDIEYRTSLEHAYWDIIVIDEAHNVALRGKQQAQRSRLAELLAERSDTLIMLSATPHDGRPASFASLVRMLDPTAIANEEQYRKEDIQGLVFRRFKKDVQREVASAFRERVITCEVCQASPQEEHAFDRLTRIRFERIDQRKSGGMLFKTLLEKSLFSSPAACIKTIAQRLRKMDAQQELSSVTDREQLLDIKEALEKITPESFSRYVKLLELLRSASYGWNPKANDDRIVLFTERIETLRFLQSRLIADLGLEAQEVQSLYGSMSDVEQQQIVDAFGADDAPVRILVASDVASEGINLHYRAHRLIHFDIPWSLMVFQQRNGRIDRYGQEQRPDIRYLVNRAQNPQIRGDLRILEILIEKEEQAQQNIGDPASIMKLYDIEAEENRTAQAIEEGTAPERFREAMEIDSEDVFLQLMNQPLQGAEAGPRKVRALERTARMPTLFNEYQYLLEGLKYFGQHQAIPHSLFDQGAGITIEMPEDMKQRLENLIPEESMPESGALSLSTRIDTIQANIRTSRQKKTDTWPKIQYLWPLHPVIEWLNDKADFLYARQQAPLIPIDTLPPDHHLFIMAGLIPNRRSTPVIDLWLGLLFEGDRLREIQQIEQVLQLPFFRQETPNRRIDGLKIIPQIRSLLPKAIEVTRERMAQAWKIFEEATTPKLEEENRKLEALRQKHHEQLALIETASDHKRPKAAQLDARRRKIDRIFDHFWQWMGETMILEKDNPYIHLVAVLTGVRHDA